MKTNWKPLLKSEPVKRKRLDLCPGVARCVFFTLLICCSIFCSTLRADSITLLVDAKSPQAAFASEDITKALRAKGYDVKKSPLKELDKTKRPG